MDITTTLTPSDLSSKLSRFWELSGQKIKHIRDHYDQSQGSPVFTVEGKYTTRGWTEWTEGFVYGSSLLQFDATGEEEFLEYGRMNTVAQMASHVGHFGVHDHGFNNVSTYGNLLRMMLEGKISVDPWEKNFYELALKLSAAVQAKRWTTLPEGGYIYSFNGPHSLFVDTIRTIRVLVVGHLLKHRMLDENDREISLLGRAMQHALATAKYSVYYGEGRDRYDVWGRTAHESIFNTNDGNFRCPNAQQGFSGFTTWTRGLSWAMAGFTEQLECLDRLPEAALERVGGKAYVQEVFLKAARATCDFYIEHTASDGIPYWDTGAPNIHLLEDRYSQPADPYNPHEPVDSSAAAIAAQGLLRLGRILGEKGKTYWQAGLTVLNSLLDEPYLSTNAQHQGLILHSIYHEPNGWDHAPIEGKVAHGESCMWGDYHAREVALYVQRMINDAPYYRFDSCVAL